jgi:D-arabinose 1-dehydrogenase-like Zn-dependent alcohol dehydrogenase
MIKRQSIAGTITGGVKATEEMLEFCHKNNIYPDCQ